MASSGSIYDMQGADDQTRYKAIIWDIQKDMSNGTITITCFFRQYMDSTSSYCFYALAGKCTYTINGVKYVVDTPATSTWAKNFSAPSVTSKPIPITAVDDTTSIDISAKWEPKGSIGYFKDILEILPEFSSSYSSCYGSIRVDPIYTSTEINLTGTEITEKSIMDMVNFRTHKDVTHSLTYTCKNVTETLFTEKSGDYLEFTLPETLASKNTKGTELSVTFELTTHFPWGVSSPKPKTKTVVYTIPDKDIFRPHCEVKVTDGEHFQNVQLVNRYGAYIQDKSRFKISVTPILAFDSEIASITIKANDETYVGDFEVETKFLKYSGEQNITVSLMDNRGRKTDFSQTVNVLEYVKPYVSDLQIDRCDRVGVVDDNGDYIKVTFSAEITPLNNINSATYRLRYQTSAGLDQTDVNLTDYTGNYNVVDGTYIFQADSGNAYSVTLTASDDLDSGFKHEGADEATTIWNALASGDGFAFGTIASLAGVLESMFKIFPQKGFMFPEYEESTLMTANHVPNVYTVKSGKDIEKSPFEGEYTLIVLPGGGVGDFLLIAITCDLEIKINSYANSSWSGNWKSLTVT